MSQVFNMIDPNEARAKLVAEIESRKVRLTALKQITETLRGLEGEPLTWRLAKKLKKVHPDLNFEFDNSYSWFSLSVGGPGISDALRLNMGYKSQPAVVSMNTFMEYNQAYFLDENRIPQMEAELVDIEDRVNRYNSALIEMRAAHNNLGEGRYSFMDNNILSVKHANGRWYSE